MAFKEKQILRVFMFIWFSFIKMSVYAVFNEGKKLDSLGSFYKSARTSESFDRGDDSPKSGEKVGRLLIWQDQASSSLGDGNDRFSSDPGFQSRPDDNAYQSDDPGWMKLQPLWGQVYGLNTLYTPTVERLLDIKPKVDCVGDLMKLTVHGRGAPFGSSFLIDRGSLQPLPLSQLPSECGHRFLRTWRDFVFIMPYDGCYVSQEKDTFVLPLLWLGLPVKMSCSSPTSAQRAPTVSCYTNGMIVRLYRRVSENLKIKVMNEWQPLLKGSARCGYSLVSHAEGVVIHAPYMPCTEPEDGMFTLSMVVEKEFNLSCPALAPNVPISLPDHAPTNYIPTSMPNAPISPTLSPTTTAAATTTTQPISTSSTVQKFPAPPLPHYIPVLPNLKPVPPSYPFLHFPPNVLPAVLPQGPTILGRPTAINQQPQTPVYVKRPPAWYPWKPMQYPRKHLLPPTKAPKTPVGPLLKPTSIPQDELTSTIPIVPPAKWAPMFPPRNVVYPSYPRKPFVPPSTVFPQDPYWPNSQNQPRPSISVDDPPMPVPTRKAGPQLFHPWYKPFPPRLPVMLPVPTKVPPHDTVFTTEADKGHPINPGSDISCSVPQLPEFVNTPAPINASLTRICSSHAHSFYGQTFCPCPPLISFHHHNHRYFGHHPFNLDSSSLTKIPGQMLSSPVISAGPTQLKWPSRPLQNGPVAEPLVYSNLKPAVYQAPMEQYVLPRRHLTQEMLVAPNKVPFFEKMVQYAISSKPTMPPGHGKTYMNPWYQPTYSNAEPPISDSPTEDPSSQLSLPDPSNNDTFEPLATPPQPERTSGGNLPGMNPLQYNSQSGESVVPVFRNPNWVPAVQTNQDALLSPAKTQMGYEMSIHSPWNLERWKR